MTNVTSDILVAVLLDRFERIQPDPTDGPDAGLEASSIPVASVR